MVLLSTASSANAMIDYSNDKTVFISALEHYSYCPRQCALIYVEKIYDENMFTLKGSMAHERAHESSETMRDGIVEQRGLPVFSERYDIYGQADVVEFHPDGSIRPVEYKHGPKRQSIHADMQVCAQAICLEEMFGVTIESGMIYSISSNARRDVQLTSALREKTLRAVGEIREMCALGNIPIPVNDSRCPNCSLVVACIPGGVYELSGLSADSLLFEPCKNEVLE